MWILFVLIVGYHDNNSQLSVEFNTKEACIAAGNSWQRQIATAPNYGSTTTSVRTLCAFKGEKPKEGK